VERHAWFELKESIAGVVMESKPRGAMMPSSRKVMQLLREEYSDRQPLSFSIDALAFRSSLLVIGKFCCADAIVAI